MPELKAGSLFAKNASLLALVFQQVALVLMIRHSRMRQGDAYVVSTAVVSAEFLKFVLNFSLEYTLVKHEGVSSILAGIMNREGLNLGIPALLYVIQNNLLFVALGNLTVPVYQVTNQGKLLTTAFFSRCMLNKQISAMQYVSLVVLALGVATVQLSSIEKKNSTSSGDQNQLLGLMAVFLSCCTSGAAGVYFEKMLKSTKKISVYLRNCQLSLYSIILGLFPVVFNDFATIRENGFFKGYDAVVVGVIVCQAMTGLIVALVMKYADTILKGFATSVAVVLATILSVFIWDAKVDGLFVIGAAMVMLAVKLYSANPANAEAKESISGDKKPLRKALMPSVLAVGIMICGYQVLDFRSSILSEESGRN